MDAIIAASLIAAISAGVVTGTLLIPAEVRRVRRFAALSAGQPETLFGTLPRGTRARNGAAARALAKLSAFFAERDEGIVAGAGLSPSAAALYRQWRPLLPALAGALAAALRWGRGGGLTWLTIAVAAAILGPEAILRALINRRRARIIREFPEVVDLLAVAAAGGSSLAGALRSVTEGASGPLSQEMRLAVREAAAGTPLHAALRQMAKRIGLPAVSAFVGSLCEAEGLGVPLADSLSIQSEAARTAYRQQVEGRLNQLPLQMTICALIFLFPTAFIIVALPNIITFTRGLW